MSTTTMTITHPDFSDRWEADAFLSSWVTGFSLARKAIAARGNENQGCVPFPDVSIDTDRKAVDLVFPWLDTDGQPEWMNKVSDSLSDTISRGNVGWWSRSLPQYRLFVRNEHGLNVEIDVACGDERGNAEGALDKSIDEIMKRADAEGAPDEH
jgi:hypothetical protein